MRIAFLSFYSGQIDRGVEVATAALAKGLGKHHEVTVFQTGERVIQNIPTVCLPLKINWNKPDASGTVLRKFYLDYWSLKIAEFTIKFLPHFFKFKYDVVIPTNGGWQLVIIRLTSWLLGKKVVVQGNAGIGFDDLFQLHLSPNHFIAISPNGYTWAKQFAWWVKKTYIPYGVDLRLFKSAPPKKLDLPKPVVLCVAAFSPFKRIDLVIKAVALTARASLLVIGQGSLEQELRELGVTLLGDRFLLKTGVPHNELVSYYKAAHVFTLPSEPSEALGIVNIEAMAAGLPVVAPDDWRRMIIGDAGIYVDPQNTEAYAKAIELALATDFGIKPLRQAEKYNWERIVEKYEAVLAQL